MCVLMYILNSSVRICVSSIRMLTPKETPLQV